MNELSADVLRLKGSVVRCHSEYIVTQNLTTMSNFTSELKHGISKIRSTERAYKIPRREMTLGSSD